MDFRYEENRDEVLEQDVQPESIGQKLRLMNDADRTFCVLSVSDHLYIQCAGSADRMIVEMRRPTGDGFRHYAIGHVVEHVEKTGPLRLRTKRERQVSETFDAAGAEALFLAFAAASDIPSTFTKRDMTDIFA